MAAAEAQRRQLRSQTEGGFRLEPVEERANGPTFRAVELLVEAHRSREEVKGMARAVGIARRGETWAPIDRHGDTEDLAGLKRSA